MVNCIQFDWSPGWIVGIDAGYWIPLLARRATTLPPMTYPLEWGDPSRLPVGLAVTRGLLLGRGEGAVPISEVLSEYDVTHVFTSREHHLVDLGMLSRDTGLKEVYRYGRGQILEVMR